jgi:hypothetical protein
MKVQCLKCPASVHSTNATWQTSFGLHNFELLESWEDFVPNSRHKAVFHLRDEDEFFVFINAHEQRIEAACSGDITRSRLGNCIDLVVENEESLFGRIGSPKIS